MQGCRALTEQEINDMLAACSNDRDRLMIMTGITFGTRITEALALKFGDFTGKTLRFKSLKKSNSQEFPIPGSYKEMLRKVKKLYREKGILVGNDTNLFLSMTYNSKGVMTLQNADQIINRLAKKIGADGKVASHSFRKSFVTRIYERTGKDIAETKKYSRHKSMANLDYYIQTTDIMDLVCDGLWG